MKIRSGDPCTIKDFGALEDLRSTMRLSRAKLVIPKFIGVPSARLDTILLNEIGMSKHSKIMANLTPTHKHYRPGHGHRWKPSEPRKFGVSDPKTPRPSTGTAGTEAGSTPATAATVAIPPQITAPVAGPPPSAAPVPATANLTLLVQINAADLSQTQVLALLDEIISRETNSALSKSMILHLSERLSPDMADTIRQQLESLRDDDGDVEMDQN